MKLFLKARWMGLVLWSALLYSCGNSGETQQSATQGQLTILIDESFQPLMSTQIDTFMGLYRQATIKAVYLPEGEIIKMLLKDSAQLAVVTRPLTPEQTTAFQNGGYVPRSTKVAVDAVAIILNKENTDSSITVDQLRDVFNGKITKWNQIRNGSFKRGISVVFDQSNSSNWLYMKEKMGLGDNLPSHIFAVKSNREVIEYVKSHPEAMGIIGVNWISDEDDSKVRGFRSEIKMMRVQDSLNLNDDRCEFPYQGCIAQKMYPLTREVFLLNAEPRTGLGTGFSSFVASQRGQLIIMKSGLLPANVQARIVDTTKDDPRVEK